MLAKVKAFIRTPIGQQVGRFSRLFGVTAVAVWLSGGGELTKSAVVGAVIASAEVVYRQARPTILAEAAGGPVELPPPSDPHGR